MINKIYPSGGTNINSGVQMALEILKQRKFKNDQASIFVLSDGVDYQGKQAKNIIKNTIENYEEYDSIIGSYTLNTFGYGKDTDSEVMSSIAESKDGTFFFIDKLEMVDECYVDCLGSILTSVGENVNLSVNSVASNIFPNLNFSRGLGGKNLWTWNNNGTKFITKCSKLIIGKTKDYILELYIPKSDLKLDGIIEVPVVNVILTAEGFNNGGGINNLKKEAELKIEFFSDNLDFVEKDSQDPEIVSNFYRLKLAETMEEAKNLADKGKYQDAKKILTLLQEEILNSKYFSNEKIKLLLEEIKIALRDVSPEIYTVSGTHNLTSNMNCNYKQKSMPTNVQYNLNSNNIQIEMNNYVKMSKKK